MRDAYEIPYDFVKVYHEMFLITLKFKICKSQGVRGLNTVLTATSTTVSKHWNSQWIDNKSNKVLMHVARERFEGQMAHV